MDDSVWWRMHWSGLCVREEHSCAERVCTWRTSASLLSCWDFLSQLSYCPCTVSCQCFSR